jgi:hypothetical protein
VLCKGCLEEHKKHSSNCPLCRKSINGFADAISNKVYNILIRKINYDLHNVTGQRNILSLSILCDNSSNGCEWIGELCSLDKHLASCGFTLLPCPNKCLTSNKLVQLLRKDMERHTKEECPKRQYECPHCREAGVSV